MESNEISLHQVKLFNYLRKATGWCTARQAAETTGIAYRTVRAHLYKFSKAGIIDQAELFPGHRYRISKMADKRNKALFQRLIQASEIFGDRHE
jgi:predicted ArsR family transcriptional regulator